VTVAARVRESRVTNGYKTLSEKLGLPARPLTPSMFAQRLASDLGCPDTRRKRARTLAEDSERAGVTTGVHPAGYTAACLYRAGREHGRRLTQTGVTGAANVSAATLGRTDEW